MISEVMHHTGFSAIEAEQALVIRDEVTRYQSIGFDVVTSIRLLTDKIEKINTTRSMPSSTGYPMTGSGSVPSSSSAVDGNSSLVERKRFADHHFDDEDMKRRKRDPIEMSVVNVKRLRSEVADDDVAMDSVDCHSVKKIRTSNGSTS
jgi:hypothetical protein